MAAAAEVLATAQGRACEDADEDIIQELIALQQVPVMAKLQFLLRSICSRLTLQASRIEKAEEQGRCAAFLKDEFEHLSQKISEGSKAEKEAEQKNLLKLIEDKLKAMDDVNKQCSEVVSGLQGVDLSVLHSLPSRLTAIEEKTPGLKDGGLSSSDWDPQADATVKERMESLQSKFDDQNDRISKLEDQIKELKASMQGTTKAHSSDIEALQKICRNLRSDIEMLPILDMSVASEPSHEHAVVDSDMGQALMEIKSRLQRKADHDIVDQLMRVTSQAKEGIDKMKAAFDELKQQVRLLASGNSRRVSSAGTQPAINPPSTQTATTQSTSHELATNQSASTELALGQPPANQQATTTNQSATSHTALNLNSQDKKIEDQNVQIDTGSQIEMASNSRRSSLSALLEQKVKKSVEVDLLDGRLKNMEKEIIGLATQLAGKADRKDLDGLQIQVTLLEQAEPHGLVSLVAYKSDGVLMETSSGEEVHEQKHEAKVHTEINVAPQVRSGSSQQDEGLTPQNALQEDSPLASELQKMKSNNVTFQIALQKLQEILSRKADREEVQQLHETIHRQRAENPPVPAGGSINSEVFQEMYKTMMLEMDNLNDKMKNLEERSDLNVLISKRLENFTQPAATVQESSQGLDEMKAAINEHADRMMEYADTLLQMEALLATKADAAGLQALRASILELKKRRSKEQTLETHSSPDASTLAKQVEPPVRILSAAEKIEKHEEMLAKLLKDMEMLGTGILTLSGHNLPDVKSYEVQQSMLSGEKDPQELLSSVSPPVIEGLDNNQPVQVGSPVSEHDQHRQESKTESQVPVAENSGHNHNTLYELEEALHENLIKPKGDAEIVNKLAEDFLPLSLKLKELHDTIRNLQDNTAEKDEIQRMKNYVKQQLERAETAMFSGKGLPGFKCMSCAHRLEKLNPNRAEFLPTNCMPRQLLPMHAAERLYNKDGEVESPRFPLRATSPTWDNQNKAMSTNSRQILSPSNDLPAPTCPSTQPKIVKKK